MSGHPRFPLIGPVVAALAVLLMLPLPSRVAAQELAAQTGASEIANYAGPDREKMLVEGAKKEGEISFYASIPVADIALLAETFTTKYGVKVKAWRADSEAMMSRILTEAKARRNEVDVMAASSSALEPLSREKLLTEVKSPLLADLIPEAVAPHRQWAAVYLNTFVQAYNTNLISRENLPKTFRDLLQPQWNGKLAIEAEDFDWFAQVVLDLGEAQGLKLFRDIVATNGISVRRGHSVMNNMVVAGEVPLALSAYGFLAEQAKQKGAPLDWFVISPQIARPTAAGVSRNAPHPHAAVLFYDFLIGDAQPILASRQFVTTSSKIESPLRKGPIRLIDSAMMLDHAKKWQDLFQRTIVNLSR